MLRTVIPVRCASSSIVRSACVTSVTLRDYTFECDMNQCNIEVCNFLPCSPLPQPASPPAAPRSARSSSRPRSPPPPPPVCSRPRRPFALIRLPLDRQWHRLLGPDGTLWGPTHLMLFGGASMTLIGQAVLLQEGMRARRAARRESGGDTRDLPLITAVRRVGMMG